MARPKPVALVAQQPAAGRNRSDGAAARETARFTDSFSQRGHSADSLRRDIDVPRKLLDKLLKRHRNELGVQVSNSQRAYQYRKQVLAIFDELVIRERIKERVH